MEGLQGNIAHHFIQALQDLLAFDISYFSLSYFEKKDIINDYLCFQKLKQTLLGNKLEVSSSMVFSARLAQILADAELYVRQKNLMMFVYRDEIWLRQDDSRLLDSVH